jgi:hypothetical protein
MRRFDHGKKGRKPNGRIFRIFIVVRAVLVRIDGKDDVVNGETDDMQHPHSISSNPKLRTCAGTALTDTSHGLFVIL